MTLFVMGIIAAAFVGGVIIGAFGHKWMARKAATIGVTPPSKLP